MHVFDKIRGAFRSHSPREIGHRRYLYLTEEEEEAADKEQQIVESFLEGIEDKAAPAVTRMIRERSPGRQDKSHISWFVASLMFRTPQALANSEEVAQLFMTRQIARRASSKVDVDDGFPPEMAREALKLFEDGELEWTIPKNFVLEKMNKAIERVSRIVFDSRWELLYAPAGKSFVSGDGAHVLNGLCTPPLSPDSYRVFVPLTSECCLSTKGGGGVVHHRQVSSQFVRELNVAITYASREIVVGRSMRLLKSLAEYLRQNPEPRFISRLDASPFSAEQGGAADGDPRS